MKKYNVVYIHGQFVDTETKKRLIPKQGHEYEICASEGSFRDYDPRLLSVTPLSSQEKEEKLKGDYGAGNYKLLLKKGQRLFYRISNTKIIESDPGRQFVFLCTLLEDLFLVLSKSKKGDDPSHWHLSECACKLTDCLYGDLMILEHLPAPSLNKLYSDTVNFYFPLQRSGSTNVFETFYLYSDSMYFDSKDLKKNNFESLASLRIQLHKEMKV